MSASTTFKQECPFCEALVPIRDPKLIGKKVKCPKCAGPFVVKAPPEDKDAADTAVTDKPPSKTKSGIVAKAAPKPTGKPGAKKKNEDVSDGKRKKGKSGPLLIGGALGLGGIIVLVIVGIKAMSGPEPPKPIVGTVSNPGPGQTPQTGKNPPDSNQPKNIVAAKSTALDPSNLLPPDTTGLFVVNVDKLRESGVIAAMQKPGTFQKDGFENVFGFPFSDEGRGVKRVITALNSKDQSVFSVVRTAHAFDKEDLIKRLRGEPQDLNDRRYYRIRRPFDGLGNLLFKANQMRDDFAVCFVDANTLVFADIEPLKQFLQDRRGEPGAKKDAAAPESYRTLNKELRELLEKVDRGDAPAIVAIAGNVDMVWSATRPVLESLTRMFAQRISVAIAQPMMPPLPEEFIRLAKVFTSNPGGALKRLEMLVREEAVRVSLALTGSTATKLSLASAVELKTENTAKDWEKAIAPSDPLRKDVTISASGKVFMANATMTLDDADYLRYQNDLSTALIQARVASELTGGRPRYHKLAAALAAYVEKTGHFPRGTMARKPPLDPEGDFRSPQVRVSWLADLLPYLPQDSAATSLKIDPDKEWFHADNLAAARAVVPFYVVRGKEAIFRTAFPGLPGDYGATHFVGMAGLGMDAATYAGNDKTKVGIFGYDRMTAKKDIPADRLDKVIALIQVPADQCGPWLAGGGASVRGASEDPLVGVQPFVATEYQSKRGAFAIMADGRVRFIPADIPPEAFRAMCTINGPAKFANIDAVAPLVPDEELVAPGSE